MEKMGKNLIRKQFERTNIEKLKKTELKNN